MFVFGDVTTAPLPLAIYLRRPARSPLIRAPAASHELFRPLNRVPVLQSSLNLFPVVLASVPSIHPQHWTTEVVASSHWRRALSSESEVIPAASYGPPRVGRAAVVRSRRAHRVACSSRALWRALLRGGCSSRPLGRAGWLGVCWLGACWR